MSLKFIFGPSGAGKSYSLYQDVIQQSMKYPDQNFIVLVPEQFTMQTQKDLVSMHPNHGIMNIDVLSFGRLAYRVFSETGGGNLPVLDDEGKNLILRKIAGDYEKQLTVLKGNMKKLGYVSEVKSALSEFTQYDIGEEQLEQVMETVGEGSGLYYKLQDLKLLYRGFQDYLDQRYITKEELLDVLSREIEKSEFLKGSTVVLDGFTGFTPVQNRLLKELLLHCHRMIVTVTMDEREDPFVYHHPYQLFAISKQMVTSLVALAKEIKIPVEESEFLYEKVPYRFRKNPPLAFLEHHIFRYGKETYEDAQDKIQIHVAKNPREETMAVAGMIRKLVRTKGYRYREIGVITSSMDTYGDALEEAFAKYEIPVFMDHKRSILLNSFVEYIRSLLNMVEQNFTYESVFRFLHTNLSGLTYDEICSMENYVLALGIKGYKKWQETWIRRPKNMTEEELATLNHSRVILVEKVDSLVFVLKQRSKTVKDITMALYDFIVQEELQLKLKQQEELFQSEGELALAKEYAQIYRILIELFDKFVELLGDEKVSLNEYCKLLDAGLSEARVGVIPPGVDQVVAGDVQRTRLKDVKALFFVGANDVHLPGNLLRTGLLSERDREMFEKEKFRLAPGGKEQAYVQKFYLYTILTKPSESLHVFYSKVSADGKSIRPSYLIQELRKLFPNLSVTDEQEKTFGEQELTEKLGVKKLLRTEHDADWMELYSWYVRKPEWKGKVERLLRAEAYQRPQDGMTEEIAKRLYGENFMDSITRIEQFNSCAFAHFLTYGLGLREQEEYEFQPIDLGNVCHAALEKYAKKMKQENLTWTEVDEEKQRQYIETCVEEAITDYGNSVLYSSARSEYMIVRMKKMLERTVWALTKQLAAGDFKPAAYELRFANGKIDRVDTCMEEDKVYVKVLDYKTGRKAFDVVSLYHGLQLQLMVYMDAAIKEQEKRYPEKEVIPAGVFYYRIQDPFVDKPKEISLDEEKDAFIKEEMLKELKPDGMINLKDQVVEHLDRKMQGESLVAPVKFNKNGSLSKASKAVSGDEFHAMMHHAVRKVAKTHEQILSGDTKAFPYRKGTESGCDYCNYRHVCGFDRKIPGYGYRDLEKFSKEEVIHRMLAEEESEKESKEKRTEGGLS